MTFSSLGLAPDVLQGVRAAGYATPSPIQAAAIPPAVEGRDLIGCAQTGTGKTAAFVLPLLHTLHTQRPAGKGRPNAPRALVVTPTRELALQVEASVRTYGAALPFRSLAIFGGVGIGSQLSALRRGVDVVVATPGRLLDHVDRGTLDLSGIEVLVLDEADRMFDMGFLRDIRRIVAAVPKKRQTLLFSATMPQEIQALANSILTRPTVVEIGERRNPAATVVQHVCSVPSNRKMDLLVHVLEAEPTDSVLVFSRTKHRADRIARKLGKLGFDAAVIHSNRSQGQRQRALASFREGRMQILVATDIAARGIDVDSISHVINYDTPRHAEDYIHRIGRTGRADATGDALTFASSDEDEYITAIERHTGSRLARKTYDGFPPDTSTPQAASARSGGGGRGGRSRKSGASSSARSGRGRSARRN